MAKRQIFPVVGGVLFLASNLAASPPQWKPSKLDADISSIGTRDIAKAKGNSIAQEEALGKQLAGHFDLTVNLVTDPDITGYVDRLGQIIARNSDAKMPVIFRVVDADRPRSFTLPGGYQYINRGLLVTVQSDAELAGVLAHGIAETALCSGSKNSVRGAPVGSALNGGILLSPDFLRMQREAVSAADYFGLQYVYVAGYDPESYVQFIERVWPELEAGQKKTPEEFSLYPPLPTRVAAMRKEIAAILPKRENAIVSTPQFKDFQERVRAWKPTPH